MSQESVELVRGLQPASDVDWAQLVRDDELWAMATEAVAPYVHPDCEFVVRGLPDGATAYAGLDGFRALWLDWLLPWATYRVEVQEAIDLGERVLLLYHAFGRREGGTQEVKSKIAGVWTVRDGKIASCIPSTPKPNLIDAPARTRKQEPSPRGRSFRGEPGSGRLALPDGRDRATDPRLPRLYGA
jgi:hypothetical protein